MENANEKWTWLRRVLSYVLVAAIASGATWLIFGRSTKVEKLQKIIENRYVGELDVEAMEDAAAQAMVKAIGDRWSYYIPADQYAAHKESKANAYVGIGISILQREDGTGFDIVQVEPGSSAQEAGVLPGDILVEADGQSLAGMDINGPGNIIRGKKGTKVTIMILRDGEKLTFELVRQMIQTEVATGELLENNVGYVRIRNFNTNCAKQTIAVIDTLVEQGATSLVFDVRNNSGGYVTEMVDVLDYLLPEGLLFQSVRYNGIPEKYKSDAACVELPMAVLVNGSSYSAAEFFAAALSEYEWATVVGEPTCGKSYFQNTFELGDGSAVGLSVGQYFTPNGISLAEQGGLVPDITLEVDQETAAMIYGELLSPEEDPQIQAAIETLF